MPFHVIEQDTYSVVKRIPEGKTMRAVRLRRGALYRYAAENGITKTRWGITATISSRHFS